MPLSANLFWLESSIQNHAGSRGAAPAGSAGGAKTPAKKNRKKKIANIFSSNIFFILKVKKKILKIVWLVSKKIYIEIGRKKNCGYIFPQFSKKFLTFKKKNSFIPIFFFCLEMFWNVNSINVMVGSFWGWGGGGGVRKSLTRNNPLCLSRWYKIWY